MSVQNRLNSVKQSGQFRNKFSRFSPSCSCNAALNAFVLLERYSGENQERKEAKDENKQLLIH
jgi:hypothetical protein